jgi:hypothetical protein
MRESRTYGSVRANAEWLSYSTILLLSSSLFSAAMQRRTRPEKPSIQFLMASPGTPRGRLTAKPGCTTCGVVRRKPHGHERRSSVGIGDERFRTIRLVMELFTRNG